MFKAGEQASDDCGLSVSVTEIETHAGRLIEKVHCTYECHQDTRLCLDYELVTEDWAPGGDEQKKRLPRIKNLALNFSSVEPGDNLVVRGEVAALQEYCEVRLFYFFRCCKLYSVVHQVVHHVLLTSN